MLGEIISPEQSKNEGESVVFFFFFQISQECRRCHRRRRPRRRLFLCSIWRLWICLKPDKKEAIGTFL